MWEVKLDHAAANITTFPPTSVQYLIWDGKEMYDGTDVAYKRAMFNLENEKECVAFILVTSYDEERANHNMRDRSQNISG